MNARTPFVVHILGELRPSGMERMLVTAASAFRDAGVQSLVVGRGDSHPFASELRASGYEVHTFSGGWMSRSGRDVARRIREVGPAAIHLHAESNYLPSVLYWRVRMPRVKIVRTIHNVFAARGAWLIKRALRAAVADRLVNCLVAPSEDVRLNELKLKRNAVVIQNWVDDELVTRVRAQRLSRIPKEHLAALVVGNCSVTKNHETALNAVDRAGMKLFHFGDESRAAPSESKLLRDLTESGTIVLRDTGSPERGLAEADVYLMPSLNEGMSVALLEALVCGLPCVVSDAPGMRWVRGLPGVVVLPPDAVVEWADAAYLGARSGGYERPELELATSPAVGVASYLRAYGLGSS